MSTGASSEAVSKGRPYDSTLRRRQAAQTRHAVLEAATTLFSERGWSVGIRDVARSAGVSVETVYSNFGSKAELLNQVLDVAVVGDERPVALMDRPEFAALSAGSSRERTQAAAALVTTIHGRTVGVLRALREAAAVEPDLAARLEEMRGRQRLNVHVAAAAIAGREVDPTQADGLWSVLSIEVYELLTGSVGWSPAQFEDWLADVIPRLLDIDS